MRNVVSIRFYTMRERDLDEIFPWDFIDTGVSKEFLKREWKNAHDEKVTPNCRMKCSGCGAMKLEEVSVLKIRIKFRKSGVMKFIGHLDIMRYSRRQCGGLILTSVIQRDFPHIRSCRLQHRSALELQVTANI